MPTQAALSTSTAIALVTADHPKGQKAVEVFRAQYNKARLDDEGAQRLNESPEFAAAIADAIAKHSITNQYADEEYDSSYGYLSGYTPKSLVEQVGVLQKLFPHLNNCNDEFLLHGVKELPDGAEGYFAIPRWEKIAKTYNEAVQIVLDLLKKQRNGAFKNWRENQLGTDRLRQSVKSKAMWEKLGTEQKDHDVLVVPAQFGIRHRGRSVRRAREVMGSSEFGLGAFAVGIMLLTHPERLQHFDDLYVDCAGDEYHDPQDSDAPFDLAPYFVFSVGKLEFGTAFVDDALEDYGSASGVVVPQS